VYLAQFWEKKFFKNFSQKVLTKCERCGIIKFGERGKITCACGAAMAAYFIFIRFWTFINLDIIIIAYFGSFVNSFGKNISEKNQSQKCFGIMLSVC
jgi:hypothetical protein